MDLLLIEIILWAGLAFFLWALRDNLSNVETELEEAKLLKSREIAARALERRFVAPDSLSEPMGSYRDVVIHRYAVLQGRRYRFEYVCPPENRPRLANDQRYLAPGLVYGPCEA